jgi:Mg2+ and Co2+ transporter CorA
MLHALLGTTDNSLTRAAWIDIVDPTPAEIAAVEKAFSLRVPVKEEVSENQSAASRTWHALYDGTAYSRDWR